MKTMQKFFVVMLLSAFPVMLTAQDKPKETETVKYSTSMTCQMCVNTIMSSLPKEKGVKDVKCDLKTKEVTVTYQKDKNNPDEIKKSLEKLGYTAKVISADNTEKKEK